jgi:hypothetical protein
MVQVSIAEDTIISVPVFFATIFLVVLLGSPAVSNRPVLSVDFIASTREIPDLRVFVPGDPEYQSAIATTNRFSHVRCAAMVVHPETNTSLAQFVHLVGYFQLVLHGMFVLDGISIFSVLESAKLRPIYNLSFYWNTSLQVDTHLVLSPNVCQASE